ncbi:MAG: hypothetical protein LBP42_05795 [Treponema sp.]|nr:hypothetical protein [Treponema sp.]
MAPYLRFILFLPHRDCGKLLRNYNRVLFAQGFWGAYSFPGAVPLGVLSRPLARGELKALAFTLRELSGAGGGKIRTGAPAQSFPVEGPARGKAELPGFTLFGPSLDLDLPPELLPPELLRFRFSPPVLCAALSPRTLPETAPPPAPEFSFRAAAAANMILSPLPGSFSRNFREPEQEEGFGPYSFVWKIGERVWLPAYKRAKNPQGIFPPGGLNLSIE